MDDVRLTVVYQPVEDGWVQARIAELPAVITVAATREEARELVLDALAEYLAAAAEDGAGVAGADAEELTLVLRRPA